MYCTLVVTLMAAVTTWVAVADGSSGRSCGCMPHIWPRHLQNSSGCDSNTTLLVTASTCDRLQRYQCNINTTAPTAASIQHQIPRLQCNIVSSCSNVTLSDVASTGDHLCGINAITTIRAQIRQFPERHQCNIVSTTLSTTPSTQ